MIEIVPAIDIIEGKCVRLTQGDYDSKQIYAEDPLEVARRFEAHGFRRLHLVDLDGAREGKVINFSVLSQIAANTKLLIDFGGGIRDKYQVTRVIDAGATQVNVGSLAIMNPNLLAEWLHTFGAERFILAADVKGSKVAIKGWQETSAVELEDLLRNFQELGLQYVCVTDVSRDGMLHGPAQDLYQRLRKQFPELCLIASGGVSAISEIKTLSTIGVSRVVVGKALYQGKISLEELEAYQ